MPGYAWLHEVLTDLCEANCIGLVKLMGRHCGFIAMNAALAARDVDLCLSSAGKKATRSLEV